MTTAEYIRELGMVESQAVSKGERQVKLAVTQRDGLMYLNRSQRCAQVT